MKESTNGSTPLLDQAVDVLLDSLFEFPNIKDNNNNYNSYSHTTYSSIIGNDSNGDFSSMVAMASSPCPSLLSNNQQQQQQQQPSSVWGDPTTITGDEGDGMLMVQESTSSLLTARAFAKAGNTTIAWEIIESLLDLDNYERQLKKQSSNKKRRRKPTDVDSDLGFLPKYRYRGSSKSESSHIVPANEYYRYYLPNSTIPSPRLVSPDTNNSNISVLAALPLHATLILQIFAASPQAQEDVNYLRRSYQRIFHYHDYLIQQRTITTTTTKTASTQNEQQQQQQQDGDDNEDGLPQSTSSRMLSIHHPWESSIDVHNLIPALEETRQYMQSQSNNTNWTVPFDIPYAVRNSYDFIPNVYEPSVYLLLQQQQKRSARATMLGMATAASPPPRHFPLFSLLDVAFTAVWVRANSDLETMRHVLEGRHATTPVENEAGFFGETQQQQQRTKIQDWIQQSQSNLEHLWNEDEQTYQSKFVNHTTATTFWLSPMDASNFVALWAPITNQTRLTQMAFRLQSHNYFGCGIFPVWTRGCADEEDTNTSSSTAATGLLGDDTSVISPLLNYLIADGMRQQVQGEERGLLGIGDYIADSTVNLVCGRHNNRIVPPSQRHAINPSCPPDLSFPNLYDGAVSSRHSAPPLADTDLCGQMSTVTAAAVYNLATPVAELEFQQDPPLQRSGVLAVILVEVVVALGMGLGCLVLSLTLLRTLQRQEQQYRDDNDDNGDNRHLIESAGSSRNGGLYYRAAEENNTLEEGATMNSESETQPLTTAAMVSTGAKREASI